MLLHLFTNDVNTTYSIASLFGIYHTHTHQALNITDKISTICMFCLWMRSHMILRRDENTATFTTKRIDNNVVSTCSVVWPYYRRLEPERTDYPTSARAPCNIRSSLGTLPRYLTIQIIIHYYLRYTSFISILQISLLTTIKMVGCYLIPFLYNIKKIVDTFIKISHTYITIVIRNI